MNTTMKKKREKVTLNINAIHKYCLYFSICAQDVACMRALHDAECRLHMRLGQTQQQHVDHARQARANNGTVTCMHKNACECPRCGLINCMGSGWGICLTFW